MTVFKTVKSFIEFSYKELYDAAKIPQHHTLESIKFRDYSVSESIEVEITTSDPGQIVQGGKR